SPATYSYAATRSASNLAIQTTPIDVIRRRTCGCHSKARACRQLSAGSGLGRPLVECPPRPARNKATTSAAAVRGTVEMLGAPERVKVSTDRRLNRRLRRLWPRPDVYQRVGARHQPRYPHLLNAEQIADDDEHPTRTLRAQPD